MLRKKILLLTIASSALCLSQNSHARLNTLTGGLAVGYDYDETKYESATTSDTTQEDNLPLTDNTSLLKQYSISPLLILETTSSIDGLSISFNPSFVYDEETGESDLDHNFHLSAYRDFSRRFRLAMSDGFVYGNDPELLETTSISDDSELVETGDISDYNRGRRRYWTNNFNVNGTYSYEAESSFGAGYTYRILRNDDTGPGGYEDYDRHIADISLQHRLNATWNLALTGSYTRGLFDPPDPEVAENVGERLEEISPGITAGIDGGDLADDLSEYRSSMSLNWLFSPRKTFYIAHSFTGSDYDADLRNDTYLHDFTLGALYQHTRHLALGLSGGPSYEKTDTYDANWDYHANFNLSYQIAQNTHFRASIDKGYDIENFSQNSNSLTRDQGITDFWEYELNLSHEFTPDLSATFFGSYRDERQQSILHGVLSGLDSGQTLEDFDNETFREESIFDREIYRAGGSLSYNFLDWYTASVNYTFRKQDSELINDSYDEHRVYLTLSVQKELLRW